MVSIVVVVFVISFLILMSGKTILPKFYKLFSLIPFTLFFYFLYYLSQVHSEGEIILKHQWIPLLGIDLNFRLDGLSLLFSLLISGIGTLIYFYASDYLKHS